LVRKTQKKKELEDRLKEREDKKKKAALEASLKA